MNRAHLLLILFGLLVAAWLVVEWTGRILFPSVPSEDAQEERRLPIARTEPSDAERAVAASTKKWRETLVANDGLLNDNPAAAATQKNAAANELFSLPELPDGVVADLARMAASPDEDEVWRDYCLQFLGSALERETGVTDTDRALARETLVKALSSTNATFAGTALRSLHRGDPADPLIASNALRIAQDPSYPAASRTAALLVLEETDRPSAEQTADSLFRFAGSGDCTGGEPGPHAAVAGRITDPSDVPSPGSARDDNFRPHPSRKPGLDFPARPW